MTYTNEFFGVSNNDPHFDLSAAVTAYEWVLAHPEEAPFVVSKMLFDNTAYYMEAQREKIEPVVEGYVAKRLNEVSLGLSRRVSKSEAAGEALDVVEAISKAMTRSGKWDQAKRDKKGQYSAAETRNSYAVRQPKQPMNLGVDALSAMTGSEGFATYAMNAAKEDGTMKKLAEQWFHFDASAH